tara:strand:- start:39 stop:224 length:186 start_codon:yes stop_codon:yes gene_type:complete
MKVGDLVKKQSKNAFFTNYFKNWVGLVLDIDMDGDPLIQWYGARLIHRFPVFEYKEDVEVI